MKKIVLFAMAACLALVAVGCGKKEEEGFTPASATKGAEGSTQTGTAPAKSDITP